MRLKIEMQANIHNRSTTKLKRGVMTWHLFTDMDNQFVEMIDVYGEIGEEAAQIEVSLLTARRHERTSSHEKTPNT